MDNRIRVAVAQLVGAPPAAWRETWQAAERIIHRAADRGAELIVLPECAWPAYFLESKGDYAEMRRGGMPAPSQFIESVRDWARARSVYICVGAVEESLRRQGGEAHPHTDASASELELFNTAYLVGDRGALLGAQRKSFLWDFDRNWFSPADRCDPIETRWGRLGVMICADARLPEIPDHLSRCGARMLLQPTAWVNVAAHGLSNPQPEFILPARAIEHAIPIASASKSGDEGGTTFVGKSQITGPDGQVLARCESTGEDLAIADIELGPVRQVAASPTNAPWHGPASRTERSASEPAVASRIVRLQAGTRWSLTASDEPEVWTVGVPGDAWALRDSVRPFWLDAPAGGPSVLVAHAELASAAEPLRSAARDGCEIAVILGQGPSEAQVRTRAAENRIFVVRATRRGWQRVEPSGRLGEVVGVPEELGEFHLATARDKFVAAGTHVLERPRWWRGP